jgi:arginyl-tRNA synthetase
MPRRDTNYKQITKSKFQTESELNLVRELIKLPDVVMQTAEDCQVSRLARYAMEVARAVHNFYEKERVIDKSGGVSEPRLALVSAAKNILERLFKILGIAAPDKM